MIFQKSGKLIIKPFYFVSKHVICRICGKKTKKGILKKHSDICKEAEVLKKESKDINNELSKLYIEAEKSKKHYNHKITMASHSIDKTKKASMHYEDRVCLTDTDPEKNQRAPQSATIKKSGFSNFFHAKTNMNELSDICRELKEESIGQKLRKVSIKKFNEFIEPELNDSKPPENNELAEIRKEIKEDSIEKRLRNASMKKFNDLIEKDEIVLDPPSMQNSQNIDLKSSQGSQTSKKYGKFLDPAALSPKKTILKNSYGGFLEDKMQTSKNEDNNNNENEKVIVEDIMTLKYFKLKSCRFPFLTNNINRKSKKMSPICSRRCPLALASQRFQISPEWTLV